METLPSFAPFKEDLISLFLCGFRENGTYLSVGRPADHPHDLHYLHSLNAWSGMIVCDDEAERQQWKAQRPRDQVVGSTAALKQLKDDPSFQAELMAVEGDHTVEWLLHFPWDTQKPDRIWVGVVSSGQAQTSVHTKLLEQGYQLIFRNLQRQLFSRQFTEDSQRLYGEQKPQQLFPSALESRIQPPLQTEKTRQAWENRGHVAAPLISFIIQSHNKAEAVLRLSEKLAAIANTELIVIDDGSAPHHSTRLFQGMPKGNQFILRANDLYEVITYDRALSMARGHLAVLLQDDDDFDGYQWIQDAVQLFAAIPELGILGGRDAISLLPFEKEGDGNVGHYQTAGNLAWTPNLLKQRMGPDPRFPQHFQYAATVNRAPMWLRRENILNRLGGIDQAFAPFQADDYDLCYRCWKAGLRVGWYPARFHIQGMGTGGMRIWNRALTHEQSIRNMRRVYALHGSELESIQNHVDNLNAAHHPPAR
jgi:GT2 family glycosyltransferase